MRPCWRGGAALVAGTAIMLALLLGVLCAGSDALAHPPLPLRFYTELPEPDPLTFWEATWKYLVLGFEHILPKGLDHILFVLALFLLSKHLKPLFLQISVFTIAHTVTLALSTLEVISLPGEIVEPLIALSIAFVAVENVFISSLKVWRYGVIFLFGLLHGMGFAGVLSEIGLPDEQFLISLLSFNVGVEVGQVTVVGLAFLAVVFFRDRVWYRRRVVIPASAIIAAVGLYWTAERLLVEPPVEIEPVNSRWRAPSSPPL